MTDDAPVHHFCHEPLQPYAHLTKGFLKDGSTLPRQIESRNLVSANGCRIPVSGAPLYFLRVKLSYLIIMLEMLLSAVIVLSQASPAPNYQVPIHGKGSHVETADGRLYYEKEGSG